MNYLAFMLESSMFVLKKLSALKPRGAISEQEKELALIVIS